MSRRRTRVALAAIFAVALAIRMSIFVTDPNPALYSGLAAPNGEIARNILVHGRWEFAITATPGEPKPKVHPRDPRQLIDISDYDWTGFDRNPHYKPIISATPGEGLLLAGLWSVTGDYDYGYAQVLQIVVDSLMTLVVFWIGMRLFRRPGAALIAAAGYAIFSPIARLANVPHVDIWAIDLNIVACALFLKAVDARRPWQWLTATGGVAGIGLWFRPVLAPFAMAIALGFWVGWRRAAVLFAIPAVVALLCIAPWIVRNYDQFGRFIYRTGTGQGTWEGLGALHNNFGAELDDRKTLSMVKRERPDLDYGTVQYDDYLRKKAIRAIRAHPVFYAKVLAYRLYVGLFDAQDPLYAVGLDPGPSYHGRSPTAIASFIRHDPLRAIPYYALLLLKPLLFLITVATLALTRRRYSRQYAMLVALILATLLPYWLFNLTAEYALPASFAYLLIAGVGIDLAIEERPWQRFGRRGVGTQSAAS